MSKDILYRILATLFIFILIFALHRFMTVGPRPERPPLAQAPLLIAHRGGAGMWPENTLFAFQNAADLGADVLEMDVHLTADDQLVVIHDADVQRTTNGNGPVSSMTVAQIQQLDAAYNFSTDEGATYPYRGQGITIPTLDQVLNAFPNAILNIEIKDNDAHAALRLSQILSDHNAQNRVIVASFHETPLAHFRRLQPEIATAATTGEIKTFYILEKAHLWRFHRPHADVYQIPTSKGNAHLDTPNFITHAHKMNQKIQYWTINDADEIQRLLSLGADGIMTDRPDIARQVFRQMGYK